MKAMMIKKKMMLDAVGGSAECSILCHHRSGSNNEQRMQGMCKKRVSHLLSPLGARDVLLLSPTNQEQEATLLLSMKERSLRLPPLAAAADANTRSRSSPRLHMSMSLPSPHISKSM